MEPRIQYAKTKDGVSIAYWTLGEGAPFVYTTSLYSHIELEWQDSDTRRWYERLAENRMLVRYDGRGTGLSDRNATDYSLDARLLDLEAVVEHLNLATLALWGSHDWGPVAIAYAARWPQRVSHLVLWCTWAKTADPTWAKSLDELIAKDWKMATEMVAHAVAGLSAEVDARFAAFMRESVTAEASIALSHAADEFDVTDLLAQVRSPTLVVHRRQVQFTEIDHARSLASRIPDARLVVLEGKTAMPWLEDTESVLRTIAEFLDDEEAAGAHAPGGVHTILFTDMESSTALRRKLGDAKVQELVRAHNTIVRDALQTNGGTEIKHTGDGIMASFSSATSALQCGIAIQRGVATHVEEHPDSPLAVYIGLNAGEPIAEEHPDGQADLFGTSVDLARRICDHAEPGQILASNVVRELSEGKGFLFGDIGDVVPKGFEEPVRLYEVRWREDG